MNGSEQPQGGDGVRGDADVPQVTDAAGCAERPGDEATRDGERGDETTRDGAGDGGGGAGDGAGGGGGAFSAVDADRCRDLPTPDPADTTTAAGPPSPTLDDAQQHLATIRHATAALRDLPLWKLGQHDLLALTRQAESALRTGYGIQVRLAGEIHERGVANILNARSAAHLLHESLNITNTDARARIAAAQATLPTETPTGNTMTPPAPELLDAIDHGHICDRHTKVITDCLAKIPAAVDPDTRAACRATLLEQARMRDANGLRQVAEQILLHVDPDGTLSGTDPTDRAELHIGQQRRDGLTPIRGLLDPLTSEHLRTAIDALSAPTPIDHNTPDPRSAPLRRAHALAEILHRYLTAGAGPRDGGVRPQVVITIGIDDLLGRTGHPPHCPGSRPDTDNQPADNPNDTDTDTDGWAGDIHRLFESINDRATLPDTPTGGGHGWFDYTGVTDPAIARMLACDAALIRQIIGADSVVLDQGRAARLFTPDQRRAITTRDKGCAFPGCDIPPAWCEAHHVIWWSHGGATDTTHGVLLCRRHHVLIHQGTWRIHTDPDGGRPWFIPPPHIDPLQQPRRNTNFHLPDLTTTITRQ
jgi:hypothetical protein